MVTLPNELIISIYELLDYQEIIRSVIIFPFLKILVLNKLKLVRTRRLLLWQDVAKKGRLDILKFFYSNKIGAPWEIVHAMDIAAANGHLEVVKFLYTNKLYVEISYDTIMNSAINGHIDIVKFLYNTYKDEGIPCWYLNKNLTIFIEKN